MRGIAVELHELRGTLAYAAPLTLSASGALTSNHVAMLRPILKTHLLAAGGDDPARSAALALLQKSDDEYAAIHNARANVGRGPWPVPYRVPFLELSLGELTLFSKEVQARLLEVLHQVHLFNEKVELVKELSRQTFDSSIEGANRIALDGNLRASQVHLGERALAIITAISVLVDLSGNARDDAR
jgi:hypothetical protein